MYSELTMRVLLVQSKNLGKYYYIHIIQGSNYMYMVSVDGTHKSGMRRDIRVFELTQYYVILDSLGDIAISNVRL